MIIVNGIAFNVLRSPEFVIAMQAVADFGRGCVPPSSEAVKTKQVGIIDLNVTEGSKVGWGIDWQRSIEFDNFPFEDLIREEMMFRVMFNTFFRRSNIREEIDALWDAKDQLPKDFKAENWMTALGLTPKKTELERREPPQRRPYDGPNGTSDEAKRIAAAALSAVKDAAAASAAVATMGRGKIEELFVAVVKETLRLHPPAPFIIRQCDEDCNIKGFNIMKDPATTVEMDPRSSLSFDSHYYQALTQKQGLFQSDAALLTSIGLARLARQLQNGNAFMVQFAKSMLKMGAIEVLTGNAGEIRKKCCVENP
ncbi:hypothetical protein IFM89_020296 [Coptis chinensis]|uniref:Peroxidase n=1 Tax=Coptis chinensis TaxID=261450 RepID=A0A835HWA8_9MAGN|nr:hypothetical protein IFM89_020296 [Coptis chinensis]